MSFEGRPAMPERAPQEHAPKSESVPARSKEAFANQPDEQTLMQLRAFSFLGDPAQIKHELAELGFTATDEGQLLIEKGQEGSGRLHIRLTTPHGRVIDSEEGIIEKGSA